MTPQPGRRPSEGPIGAAVRRMEEGGYRHLPVVDEAGRPRRRAVRQAHRALPGRAFPATVYNLPPDPGAVPHEPEGA